MPTYSIHIVNSDFISTNSYEASSAKAARSEALKGALEIGSEEIRQGKSFFGAEIRIEDGGEVVERMMVAVGASALQQPLGTEAGKAGG
jgi:hypothetical protein